MEGRSRLTNLSARLTQSLREYQQQNACTAPGSSTAATQQRSQRSDAGVPRGPRSSSSDGRAPQSRRLGTEHVSPHMHAAEADDGIGDSEAGQQQQNRTTLEQLIEAAQAIRQYGTQAAAQDDGGVPTSQWQLRAQQQHQQWRAKAASHACAYLERQAAPPDVSECTGCHRVVPCTIRYW